MFISCYHFVWRFFLLVSWIVKGMFSHERFFLISFCPLKRLENIIPFVNSIICIQLNSKKNNILKKRVLGKSDFLLWDNLTNSFGQTLNLVALIKLTYIYCIFKIVDGESKDSGVNFFIICISPAYSKSWRISTTLVDISSIKLPPLSFKRGSFCTSYLCCTQSLRRKCGAVYIVSSVINLA